MTDRRSHRQQCVNDRNSIRYPVDIDDRRSTLHSHPFMRRYACRVKPEQRSTIFLVRHIFNYEAGCRFLQISALGDRTHRESCFCPDFLLSLSCACHLRLSTARHSYLINKLQLIAHAAGRTNYTSEFSVPTGIRSSGFN